MDIEKIDVKELHDKICNMSLGDLLIVCGHAVNMNFPDSKLQILFEYLDIALIKRRLGKDR